MHQGILTKWDDAKGYGFIGRDGEPDVFIHISAFPPDGRRLQTGDRILFQLVHEPKARLRAINAVIAGVFDDPGSASPSNSGIRPPLEPRRPGRAPIGRPRNSPDRYPVVAGILFFLAMVALLAVGLEIYRQRIVGAIGTQPPVLPAVENREVPVEPERVRFHCDGKTRCGEMSSCEEALFYLQNCPGTRMDGDHDGIPCEDQWCGH